MVRRNKDEIEGDKEKEKLRNLLRRRLIKLGVFFLPSVYIIFDGTKNKAQAQTLKEEEEGPAPKIRITDMKGKKKREEEDKRIKRIFPKSFDSDREYEKDNKRILNKKTEKGYRSVFEKYGSVGEDE